MTRFIDAPRDRFGVEPICRVLQVGPSTYYAARNRQPSARRVPDDALKVKLRHIHAEHLRLAACTPAREGPVNGGPPVPGRGGRRRRTSPP